ncbi:MAG: glycosyltransferase [Gammaproteobacteria bacterium]
MFNTVHIIGSKLSGGAERFYMRLVHALYEQDKRTYTITRSQSMTSKELNHDIEQYHAEMRNKWDVLSILKIRRIIKTLSPDIVQTYMTRATRMTRMRGIRDIVHVARLGGYYKVPAFSHADAWIGNTKGICDYLIREGLPSARVFYIGNFVDEVKAMADAEKAQLRRQLDIPDDAMVVLGVGRVNAVKGFDVLLDAFASVNSRISGRSVYLVVIGDGNDLVKLRAKTKQIGLDDNVRWMGWQQSPEQFYQLCDLYVSCARHEPLGNVILEAWSHNKPVLATRTMGAEELITHGETGWLVPVEDASLMAKGINELLSNDTLRQQCASKGNDLIHARFTKSAIVKEYIGLYSQLTGK